MEQAFCLICFHPSKNVSGIVNNNLWKVCEQLAEIKLENPPRILCSLCHTRLRQAQQLFLLAQRTHLQNSNEGGEIEEKVELVILEQSDLVNYSVPKYADQIKQESKDSIGPVTGTSDKTYQRKINSKSLENQLPSPDTNSDENVVLRRCLYIVDKPRKKIENLFSQETQNTEVDPLLTTNVPLKTSNHTDSEIPFQNDIISTPNANSSSLKDSLIDSSNTKSEPPKKKIMQSGNIYPCKKCAMEFIYKRSLQLHNTHSHPRIRKTYYCEFCAKDCLSKHNLISHTRVHTGERPYECAECGGCFMTKSTLTRHILVTHLKHKPYVCQTCGKAFPVQAALRVHERTHTGERPYPCQCGASYTTMSNFKLHFRTGAHLKRLNFVHRKKKIPCVSVSDVLDKVKGLAKYHRWPKSDSCTAGTTETTPTEITPAVASPTETTLTETTATVTTLTKTKFPEEHHCHFCGVTCGEKWRLRSHMRVHLMFEVGQFPCPVCRETCTSLDHLVTHLVTHPDSDSCQTCNVTFVNSLHMKLHIGRFHANTV